MADVSTANPYAEHEALALRVREHVVGMAQGGGCYIGASMSCVELLVWLYSGLLRVSPEAPSDPDRDYLFVSKGHAAPALYATLAERRFFDVSRLAAHLSTGDSVYWQTSRAIPGVELGGTRGHLAPVAVGVAIDLALRGSRSRVFLLIGDGELEEGVVWESLLVAKARTLDNLVIIVDRNEMQANRRTEDLVPLEPLTQKLEAFGAVATRVDGHRFAALDAAMRRLPLVEGKPSVIIADTVRGKGVPSIERRIERWFCALSAEEARAMLVEVRASAASLQGGK
jgi:transketolase